MATAAEITTLRGLIAEPDDVAPYTDVLLGARIDAAIGDLNATARDVWLEKAAGYAELVDVTEGGSSRKMGDLHEQALNMVKYFTALTPEPAVKAHSARLSKLTR